MKSKWVLGFYTIIGLFAVYLAAILPNYNFITLSRSTGDVRVEYLRNYNGEMPRFSSELAHLYTEEEAFEISHSPAFQGKIVSIRNIRALFHGESSLFDTFAIANVRVEKVFSGELSVGDTVRILLPCPIARNIWVEHMDIVSQCRTGMRGIFLPHIYCACTGFLIPGSVLPSVSLQFCSLRVQESQPAVHRLRISASP